MQNSTEHIRSKGLQIEAKLADFAYIIESAPNLVYIYDLVANANVYANRSIGEMLGYSKQEVQDLGSDLMTTAIHPSDLPLVLANFDKIRHLKNNGTASLAYRVRHKSGETRWLFSQDTVFARDATGAVTHLIGTASDITAQKRAEETALRSEAETRAVNADLTAFSYALSHDMKAPSNTLDLILRELRLSLGPDISDDVAELMSLADETLARMKALVTDTLDFAMAGNPNAEFAPVDLNAVLGAARKALRADLHHSGGTLTIAPLPKVLGIESQLLLLFQNLIQNALKFHRPGHPPVVSVSADIAVDTNYVYLRITDNGIGIPEAQQDYIFQMFKRLAVAHVPDGSGIGLATCNRIAMNHGTQITLHSQQNEGSSFSIRLKRA